MIKRNDLFHIEFYKHTYFSGSYRGMRYRIEPKENDEGEKRLLLTIFPGPYGYDATPAEQKETLSFPFSDEGLDQITEHLNKAYEADPEGWEEASRIC